MTRHLELWQLDCRKYNVSELKSLGGFKNVRSDYDWEGFKLELDETKFDWGTVYEIEVETVRLSSSPCISVCCPAILYLPETVCEMHARHCAGHCGTLSPGAGLPAFLQLARQPSEW